MINIAETIKSMPHIGSTIRIYGEPVKVEGIKITGNAAYVTYYDECGLAQDVNTANLDRVK